MVIFPEDPNLIHVETIRYGCLKRRFISTYPYRLNGIVSPEEFDESIDNINTKFSIKARIFCIAVFIFGLLVGHALMIVSWTIASHTAQPIFLAIGIAILPISSIVFAIGLKCAHYREISKLRQVIEEESQRYSKKSPIASSWRLITNTKYISKHGRCKKSKRAYHLVIAIHSPPFPEKGADLHTNQLPVWSTSDARQETPPPPYPSQFVPVCSQCGRSAYDPMANFCSSCGHQLD